MPGYYIGLISGTSMDGIDAALVGFGDRTLDVRAARTFAYPPALRDALIAAMREPQSCTIDTLGTLDCWTGECFRDAALALLKDAGADAAEVRAIGSHGQTVRHRPDAPHPFSLQIGNADVIAKGTGITCVADFRSADIALGGQGAPLVPPFHDWLLRSTRHERCVVNIGGIANLTILAADGSDVRGFDTGPGNTLLDAWTRCHRAAAFDADGRWAASGDCDDALLERMLADPYFAAAAPKSTGFEYFNEAWLQARIGAQAAADIQATLCELTARSIAAAVAAHAPATAELLACGGGVHNGHLMARLSANLPGVRVASTAEFGLDPDRVEACAFAWLAMRTLAGRPGNAPAVTGARRAAVLGAVHDPD